MIIPFNCHRRHVSTFERVENKDEFRATAKLYLFILLADWRAEGEMRAYEDYRGTGESTTFEVILNMEYKTAQNGGLKRLTDYTVVQIIRCKSYPPIFSRFHDTQMKTRR